MTTASQAVHLMCVVFLSVLSSLHCGGAWAQKADSKTKLKTKTAVAKPGVGKGKKKTLDYNALGSISYQKGNFPDALKFFDLATKNDAKNPVSWINLARATVALNIATEPVDYCDYSKNWIFDALASLSKASALNRAKASAALKSMKDPSFAKFRKRPEYVKWSHVDTLPLKTDVATQEFLAKYNDWLIMKQPMPATVVTFAPTHELTISAADGARDVGTWSAGADRVVIQTKATARTLNLTTANYQYDGAKSFRIVVLKDTASAEQWVMGPEIADCPK